MKKKHDKQSKKWKNHVFSLDHALFVPKHGKILSENLEKASWLKRIYEKRFFLGFRRLATQKKKQDGRFLFLTSDFTARTPEQNTRLPINYKALKNIAKPEKAHSVFAEEYSFLIITDLHLKEDNARGIENIKNIVKPSDEFLIINGDLTNSGTREQMNLLLHVLDTVPIPVYPVIGNHDIYFHAWPLWQELFGETIYRIDSGNTTLLILDSANGRLGQQQMLWIEQQLKQTREHVFVFSHCNFFIPRFSVLQQFAALWERNHIFNLFHNKVDAVFTGHSHKRHIHIAKEVPYVNLDDFRDKNSFCRVYVTFFGIRYEYGNI